MFGGSIILAILIIITSLHSMLIINTVILHNTDSSFFLMLHTLLDIQTLCYVKVDQPIRIIEHNKV